MFRRMKILRIQEVGGSIQAHSLRLISYGGTDREQFTIPENTELNKNECVTTNLTAKGINGAEMEWVKVTQCKLKEQDNYERWIS